MDPEALVECPYDRSHQIRAKRYPYHVVKCRENNVKAARDTGTCPYNARHRPSKDDLDKHISECPDRWLSENFEAITVNPATPQRASGADWQTLPGQENWENDTDGAAAPFVLDQGGLSFIGDDLRKPIERVQSEQREEFRSPQACATWDAGASGWEDNDAALAPFVLDQGSSFNDDELRKQIEREQSEQRKDFRSPQACATWDAGASGWEDVTPVVRRKTSRGAGATNRFPNDRRNVKPKTPAVTESSAKSNPWRSELSPKRESSRNRKKLQDKDDLGHLQSPPRRPETSENLMTGQSATRMEQKPDAMAGQSSSPWKQKSNPWKRDRDLQSPPRRPDTSENLMTGQSATRMEQKPDAAAGPSSSPWKQKSNPRKTDMGHLQSPPRRPDTSENPRTAQSAAGMEQTSYAVAGQGSSPVRQKVNSWKTDMGHLHSPPPKTGQSAARMEQKTYAVAGQSSSPQRKTAIPWKTDAQSYPATFCDDSIEHFPLLSDHRPSKKEQKLQKQMPTWGQKVNFGKDVPGLEVVVSPPSPQFADDLSASGQGQNESRVQKEGQKEGPKEGPKNKRGGRGGLTWGASSGPSKTGPSQEKQD